MARKIEVTATLNDEVSKPLVGIQGKLHALTTIAGNNREGMNKLRDGFKDAAKSAFGLQGASGQLGEALLAFGGGSLLIGGVVAGFGLLKREHDKLGESQALLQDSSRRLRLSMAETGVEALKLATTFAQADLDKAAAAFADKSKSIGTKIRTGLAVGLKSNGMTAGIGQMLMDGVVGDLGALKSRVQDAQAAYNDAKKNLDQQIAEDGKKQADTIRKARADAIKAEEESQKRMQAVLDKWAKDDNAKEAALIKLVALRRDDVETRKQLEARYQEELAYLNNLTPNTADYVDQLERVLRVEQALTDAKKVRVNERGDFSGLSGEVSAQLRAVPGLLAMQDKLNQTTKAYFDEALSEERLAKVERLQGLTNLAVDSFYLLFDTIGEGGNIMKNFGAGAVRMFAQYAKSQASMHIAEGFGAIAKSLTLATNPFTAGLAGIAKSGAAKHFLAAAKWAVIGGAGGALGGALGGNSSGGSSSGVGSNAGRPTLDSNTIQQGSATIVIQGGLLNMNDPEQSRALAQALGTLTNRRVQIQRA
jgi:hypothetical protein